MTTDPEIPYLRKHGTPPYEVAVVHGGPGAGGEMAPVARRLATERGVLEPIQTATSLEDQVGELRWVLVTHGVPPVTLIGYSWGAWLSFITAARYPALVRKLILVGSGPFEATYVAQLQEARLSRLSPEERAEFERILERLGNAESEVPDALLARLGALAAQTDAHDPVDGGAKASDRVNLRGRVYQNVWEAAAALRKSGELLAMGAHIHCPVVAIHGDYDPHPWQGVEEPLSDILEDFRFVLLKKCGHTPWQERQAQDAFYKILEEELGGCSP